jgi:HSP20 family protein
MALIRFDPFRGMNRYDPFREMSMLQREMNRLFDGMMTSNSGEANLTESYFIPAIEIHETPE